jgi:triacylglycerol lipase
MASAVSRGEASAAPLRGELRYGFELARLLADRDFLRPARRRNEPPVLLIPGFMAGDQSLGVLAGWLRRRGSRTSGAGMVLNADCAERAVASVESRLRRLAGRAGRPVVLIGQSRGGALARVAAQRNPELVCAVVMLGSPVVAPLDVGPAVISAVRSIAWLGDLGVPGMLSSECRDGPCCAAFREDLSAALPQRLRVVSIYSRSDGIVSWEACLDPGAEHVEVDSSHTGMSVNVSVYRVLARVLDEEGQHEEDQHEEDQHEEGQRWSG